LFKRTLLVNLCATSYKQLAAHITQYKYQKIYA
jgi:hypothetical protein